MNHDPKQNDDLAQGRDLDPADAHDVDVVFDHPAWMQNGIDATLVQSAVTAVLARSRIAPCAVTVMLADDARVRALNAQFRGKDQPTNVLSFPSGDDEYVGDIALAVETVIREAGASDIPLRNHVTHLVVHGTLHLLGHDHEHDDEAEDMERIEVKVLDGLGVANPYDPHDAATDTGGTSVTTERRP